MRSFKPFAFLTFIVAFSLVSCGELGPGKFSKPAGDARKTMGLKGDISQLTEKRWEHFDSTAQLKAILSSIPEREQRWEFNETGQKTDFKDWKLGKRLNWVSYRYDDFGRLQHWHSIDAMERQDQTVEFEYNAQGQLSESQRFNLSGEMLAQNQYWYDAKGRENRSLKTSYHSNDKRERHTNICESKTNHMALGGVPMKKVITTQNDTLQSESFYENGKLDDFRTFFPNGKISKVVAYPDGKKLFEILTTTYDNTGQLLTAQREFLNEKDQVFRIYQHNMLDEPLFWETRAYDTNGNVTETKQAISTFVGEGQADVPADTLNPTVQRYEYRYDSLGNWKQRLSFENGKMIEVRVREFKH